MAEGHGAGARMIPLRITAEVEGSRDPFIARLNRDAGLRETPHDVILSEIGPDGAAYKGLAGTVRLRGLLPLESDGDVLLVLPERGIAHRLIRASSPHNTLVITERCDQTCVMCSQPPKRHHVDLFGLFETAALLAPPGATIGLSGGEPTLYKIELFAFLHTVLQARPDLSFHILSNGQHFTEADLPALRALPRGGQLWGIPLYAADPGLHDRIVGKAGAFEKLLDGLSLLCRAGAAVELRTVVMTDNAPHLPVLARFVASHVPFAVHWAIMQLENIGFARQNWDKLFFDNSAEFTPVAEATDIARACGVNTFLYNFPLCTVPVRYRSLAVPAISDWKRRYMEFCASCSGRNLCGGFFEWHPMDRSFSHAGPL
jgi:His-Xaa-Ser system radical SAM maturase HxsC